MFDIAWCDKYVFLNKFLFLFLSNLQTQLYILKKYRNFLQETTKKQNKQKKFSTNKTCI